MPIFLFWPHFGFDTLFGLFVLLVALRKAFKLKPVKREAALFVHVRPYFFICRSQGTFILGGSSETILLFVDSGGIEVVLRKFFLVPESGNRDILLLFFSCTNKRTCGDMKDR